MRSRNVGKKNYFRQSARSGASVKMFRRSAASGSSGVSGVTKHRCAICGRTEADSPDMQFRFCSKCEGNYEYCEEHLYTHKHVKMSDNMGSGYYSQ